LIGRTERGFDYLGYFLKPDELTVSDKTVKRFANRIVRLYEQGADSVRIGQYVVKWQQWVHKNGAVDNVSGVKKIILMTSCFSDRRLYIICINNTLGAIFGRTLNHVRRIVLNDCSCVTG